MKMPIDEMSPTVRWIAVYGGAIGLANVSALLLWARARHPLFYGGTQIPASNASIVAGLVAGWVGYYAFLGLLPAYFFAIVVVSIIAQILVYLRDRKVAQRRDDLTKHL